MTRKLTSIFVNTHSPYFYRASICLRDEEEIWTESKKTDINRKDYFVEWRSFPIVAEGFDNLSRCSHPHPICPFCYHGDGKKVLTQRVCFESEFDNFYYSLNLGTKGFIRCAGENKQSKFERMWGESGVREFSYSHCGCAVHLYWEKISQRIVTLSDGGIRTGWSHLAETIESVVRSEYMASKYPKKLKAISNAESRFFQMTNAAAQLKKL